VTKISQLSSIGDSLAIGDQFLIRDIDDAVTPNKSVTISGMTRALDTGTLLAPALAFASDKNTGIYSPGADTLAFVEGGTEAMRIDSSGNVGIGTSSPAYRLDVAGSIRSTGGANALRLENIANNGVYALFTRPNQEYRLALNINNNGERTFDIYDNTNLHFVDQYEQGASGYRRFFTNGTERARIDSSGNVGIGTSSPTTLLDVNANTIRVRTARTPASASATGATGEICWDANYIYVCTATNTWKRTAISTW
jgi:hypothetical protein